MDYRVLLYYKFAQLPDPEAVRAAQEAFCRAQGLKGRILVAKEGINGTVSGLAAATDAYKAWMLEQPEFQGIEFKEDPADHHTFLKLHVRVKTEIVRFDVGDIDPATETGPYIEPEEFAEVLARSDEDPDIVILDTRSDYEFAVGKFKNAITLDINNFRELPQQLEKLRQLRDKKIYSYCTGGIRCEKVTAWMKKEGFEQVWQLHGGIINYGKVTGGKDFEGQCYVFDQRVTVPVNTVNPTVIGHCAVCGAQTEHIVNCANADCNKHFLLCDACGERLEGCCSEACRQSPHRRQYDGRGYYLRGVNSKQYAEQ